MVDASVMVGDMSENKTKRDKAKKLPFEQVVKRLLNTPSEAKSLKKKNK